jgi:hypothetical protein
MHMATEAIPGLTANHGETTIPALVVSSFFNGVTPPLEKLASLCTFCQSQFDYYTAMGVGEPLLGPYEALGRAFAETDGFSTKYGSLSTEFVATAYSEVFGKPPSSLQASHFQAQVDYFTGIYIQAGIAADNASLLAKGAALGQMLGVAALHGAATLNYYGAAQGFIGKMGDAGFVAGKPLLDYLDAPPDDTGPPPDPLFASVQNNVLTLSATDTYKFAIDDAGNLTITRAGTTEAKLLSAAEVTALTDVVIVSGGARVDIKAEDVTGLHVIKIDGPGLFNITDVPLDAAPFANVPNMSMLTFDSAQNFGVLPTGLLVNGNVGDALLTMWAGITLGYYAGLPSGSAVRDWTLALLANDYVRYLETHDPIDTVAVVSGGPNPRAQTLHDNLLGRINDQYVAYRINAPDDYLDARSPEAMAYASRPYAAGYTSDPADERAALAWDYSHGISHASYVSHATPAAVDAAGQSSANELWYPNGGGSGVSASGFAIGRHEGAGVEVGLKVKAADGTALAPTSTDPDGTAHFSVPAGSIAVGGGSGAKWDIDFSALTGLNGRTTETLDTYAFTLRIDTDPTAGVHYRDFILSGNAATGIFEWSDGAAGVFPDADGISPRISQNSLNFGLDFIKAAIDIDPGPGTAPYDFGSGLFDVELIASKGGVRLVGAHVVVDVA